MAARVVSGDVEACLQRLQWRPGQPFWGPFRFNESPVQLPFSGQLQRLDFATGYQEIVSPGCQITCAICPNSQNSHIFRIPIILALIYSTNKLPSFAALEFVTTNSGAISDDKPASTTIIDSVSSRKCRFETVVVIGCTEGCHFGKFRCSQWGKWSQKIIRMTQHFGFMEFFKSYTRHLTFPGGLVLGNGPFSLTSPNSIPLRSWWWWQGMGSL